MKGVLNALGMRAIALTLMTLRFGAFAAEKPNVLVIWGDDVGLQQAVTPDPTPG